MSDGQATLAIGAAVTLMVEIAKTLMPPSHAKKLGPYLALAFSLMATVVYVVSAPTFPPLRTDIWSLFLGWLEVLAVSVGVYHGAKLTLKAAPGREPRG